MSAKLYSSGKDRSTTFFCAYHGQRGRSSKPTTCDLEGARMEISRRSLLGTGLAARFDIVMGLTPRLDWPLRDRGALFTADVRPASAGADPGKRVEGHDQKRERLEPGQE